MALYVLVTGREIFKTSSLGRTLAHEDEFFILSPNLNRAVPTSFILG